MESCFRFCMQIVILLCILYAVCIQHKYNFVLMRVLYKIYNKNVFFCNIGSAYKIYHKNMFSRAKSNIETCFHFIYYSHPCILQHNYDPMGKTFLKKNNPYRQESLAMRLGPIETPRYCSLLGFLPNLYCLRLQLRVFSIQVTRWKKKISYKEIGLLILTKRITCLNTSLM